MFWFVFDWWRRKHWYQQLVWYPKGPSVLNRRVVFNCSLVEYTCTLSVCATYMHFEFSLVRRQFWNDWIVWCVTCQGGGVLSVSGPARGRFRTSTLCLVLDLNLVWLHSYSMSPFPLNKYARRKWRGNHNSAYAETSSLSRTVVPWFPINDGFLYILLIPVVMELW